MCGGGWVVLRLARVCGVCVRACVRACGVCVWVGEKRRLGRCGWEAGRRLIGWVYRWGGRCVRGRATGGLSWVGLGGGVSGFL